MYKVFVVDDEYRVKERLLNVSEWHDSAYIFCGEASDGEMALSLINQVKPDIVITDIEMPFMNGIELATILKSTMPWIRIIFLSGYDEFEYVQEALKIGVSDYILKPFRFKDLKSIMDKVVKEIEEEKEKNMHLIQMKNKLESINDLKKDGLFERFICGRFNTKELIEEYAKFNIDILANYYMVIDVKITCTTQIAYIQIKHFCMNQLDKLSTVLWYYRMDDRLIVVIMNDDPLEIKEQTFSLASITKYEVEKNEGYKTTIGIGNIVERMRFVAQSSFNANKARTYLGDLHLGQTLYIEDINSQMIDTLDSSHQSNLKISRLELEDIDEFLDSVLKGEINSSELMNYYKLISIIFECIEIVTDLEGDPKEVLPIINEKEIVHLYATDRAHLENLIKESLRKTIELRHEKGRNKYHDIIKNTKDYINEHFAEISISLNSVAKQVHLSPNHFSMIFSNETNHTFIEYLTKTRLNKAKVLLEESEMKLAEIAVEVGYNEAQYFSYIFKKNFGIGPKDYRMKHK